MIDLLLIITLVLAPYVTPLVVAGAALTLVFRVRRRRWGAGWQTPNVGSCALVTLLAGAAALGAYATGIMAGFYVLHPDQVCGDVVGVHVVARMSLPVSALCVTQGNGGTELVPVWVNPVIYGGLLVCALTVAAGVVAGVRRWVGAVPADADGTEPPVEPEDVTVRQA
ncbi:hypothetical protein ACFYWX_36620 [Streptomyces sp. NPDC002888]|uniref:hypothetical protein n=1 Tax=Streptomyces sp. NPDC002888 TaxID=3364668 RepID=UPI0036AC5E71